MTEHVFRYYRIAGPEGVQTFKATSEESALKGYAELSVHAAEYADLLHIVEIFDDPPSTGKPIVC